MLKGASAAVVIIVLLIIGIAVYFLFTSGGNVGLFQGGGPVISERSYSNDIISIEDKSISIVDPFANSETSLSFDVKNNGDKDVDVKVIFTNLPGFSSIEIKCGDTQFGAGARECDFSGQNRLKSLDAKKITAVLTAADLKVVTPVKIFYEVNYNYHGEKEGRVPILGVDTKNLPSGVSFITSSSTYGPVQVDIDPPVGRRKQENNAVVTENFGREGLPFSMKFSFRNVGKAKEIVLNDGSQILEFDKNELEIDNCDRLASKNGVWSLSADEKFDGKPLTVGCTFKPKLSDVGLYEFVDIKVSFDYMYRLTFEDSFTVRAKSTS